MLLESPTPLKMVATLGMHMLIIMCMHSYTCYTCVFPVCVYLLESLCVLALPVYQVCSLTELNVHSMNGCVVDIHLRYALPIALLVY